MPASSAPPEKLWIRRSGVALYVVLQSWWKRRISFLLSLAITASALAVYYFVFLQETKTPISEFAQRLELNTLDTRFRYRPRRFDHPDPRIVIVDIDQHSQEVLGKWPFSRAQFAKLLDTLHEDGAKVAAFDITFSKPDQSAAPIRTLWAELEAREKRGEPVDAKLAVEVQRLLARYNADKQFAEAIHHFGPVVLGNFFLYTDADLRGIEDTTLDAYANQLAFFAFPQVIGNRQGFQKEDRVHLIEEFAGAGLLPKGAEANIDVLTGALGGGGSWTGFFNAPPDSDGVVRRATTILAYGRSQRFEEWDLYGSLDVMTVRAYLAAKDDETVLRYGPAGITEIQLGPQMRFKPDERGQLQINFQGPVGSFAHYSMADVVVRNFSPGTFRSKIVLIGATATGIGDMKTTPYGGTDYPGVEIHANVIDNILNQRFLESGPKQALTDVLLIFFVWGSRGDLDGPGLPALDVVWTRPAPAICRRELLGVSAWLVAELHRSFCDPHEQRAPRCAVPRADGRKRKAAGPQRLRAIPESRSDPASAGKSGSGSAAQDGDHRDVQRHPRIHDHLRKAGCTAVGAIPEPVSFRHDAAGF